MRNNNNKKEMTKSKIKEPRKEKENKPAYQRTEGTSYAAVAKNGAQMSTGFDRYGELLQIILDRIEKQEQKQEKAIGSIIQRLSKLENSIRVAPATHV
jgi:hypothetical protein